MRCIANAGVVFGLNSKALWGKERTDWSFALGRRIGKNVGGDLKQGKAARGLPSGFPGCGG